METTTIAESSSAELGDIAVVIPAWTPERNLLPLLEDLGRQRFAAIVLIDDGSDYASQSVFTDASKAPGVRMLRHAVNLGKGRALKTALSYVLTELPEVEGVVTADADGQHAVEDIVAVALSLHRTGRPVLGTRTFDKDVPFRSRFGNTLTRYIFLFLAGQKIKDTQSGLRGFPRNRIPEILPLAGERYEFEMNVLAHLCRRGDPPIEVPISTIYIQQNRSSHFDPVRDSMRIYFILLRFYASSLIAAGIDFAGFTVTLHWTQSLPLSVFVGRLSSIVNYLLNRKFVFQSGISVWPSLWRYYLLVALFASIAYGLIRGAVEFFGWNPYVAKIIAETFLSLASFALQRVFVFPTRSESQT